MTEFELFNIPLSSIPSIEKAPQRPTFAEIEELLVSFQNFARALIT